MAHQCHRDGTARLYADTQLKTARLEALIRVSRVMTSRSTGPDREVLTEAMTDLAPDIVVRMWETPEDARCGCRSADAPERDGDDGWCCPPAPVWWERSRRGAHRSWSTMCGTTSASSAAPRSSARLRVVPRSALPARRTPGRAVRPHADPAPLHRRRGELFASLAQRGHRPRERPALSDLRQSHHELLSAQASSSGRRAWRDGQIAAAVAHEAAIPRRAEQLHPAPAGQSVHTGEDSELLTSAERVQAAQHMSRLPAFGRRALRSSPRRPARADRRYVDLLQRDDRCPAIIGFERRFDPALTSVTADRTSCGRSLESAAQRRAGMRLGGTLSVETRRVGRHVEVLVRDTGRDPASILRGSSSVRDHESAAPDSGSPSYVESSKTMETHHGDRSDGVGRASCYRWPSAEDCMNRNSRRRRETRHAEESRDDVAEERYR